MNEDQAMRPSGATLEVVKRFPTKDDCLNQCKLMRAAGSDVALPIYWTEDRSFAMPLAKPMTPGGHIELIATYWRLWAKASPRGPFLRDMYHSYVIMRPETDEYVAKAKRLAADIYLGDVRNMPVEQTSFTHGDAIVSNSVMTSDGARLIDFSPRISPPERELDMAKLLFSAQGFDLRPEVAEEFFRLLQRFLPSMNSKLLGYYLATHVARVASKEPPLTIERAKTYERSLAYANQLASAS